MVVFTDMYKAIFSCGYEVSVLLGEGGALSISIYRGEDRLISAYANGELWVDDDVDLDAFVDEVGEAFGGKITIDDVFGDFWLVDSD